MRVDIKTDYMIQDARQVFKDAAQSFRKTLVIARNSDGNGVGDESEKVREGDYLIDMQ